jgi:hypothetical protein
MPGNKNSGRRAVDKDTAILRGSRTDRGKDTERISASTILAATDGAIPLPTKTFSAVERAYWDQIFPSMLDNGVICSWHHPTMTALCQLWALSQQLLKEYKKLLKTDPTSAETSRVGGQYLRAEKAHRDLAIQFGMTPAAFSKLPDMPRQQVQTDDQDEQEAEQIIGF